MLLFLTLSFFFFLYLLRELVRLSLDLPLASLLFLFLFVPLDFGFELLFLELQLGFLGFVLLVLGCVLEIDFGNSSIAALVHVMFDTELVRAALCPVLPWAPWFAASVPEDITVASHNSRCSGATRFPTLVAWAVD